MKSRRHKCLITLALLLSVAMSAAVADEPEFTDTFRLEDCRLRSWGRNEYFPLRPGYELLLEGEEDGETVTVLITVMPGIKHVDGARCRVIREMEWADGELVEISCNYFAICWRCGTVFYLGEDVDIYEDGEVVSHEGAWLAGESGATPGVIMPGFPLVGSRYYQELAPGVALDRAEHTSVTATVETPAGTFENCLTVVETTPLEPGEESEKAYAPGIGLVRDDELLLVEYGRKVNNPFPDGEDEEEDD